MNLTRRDATRLVLAGTALAVSPLPGFAATKEEWAIRLQADLNTHLLPNCNGKLTLDAFGAGRQQNKVQMAAIIRLDWPPGTRTRRFDAFGEKDEATYASLLNQALFSFAKAWSGCVV